jgi:hypothetical protein
MGILAGIGFVFLDRLWLGGLGWAIESRAEILEDRDGSASAVAVGCEDGNR